MLSQELSEMDRVTQLQDALEQLFLIMGATLNHLTSKASLAQVSPSIPVWKSRDKADPPDAFLSNQKELVADFVNKAKQIEVLINSLPPPDTSDNQTERLHQIEAEMKIANDEYKQALQRASE
ncbi:hypothetical protein FRB99_004297 [Tulasnella sp. 403]|nr:hypothetical protein FRB99_004297 [Tulasnella sp. 403]